MKDKDKLSDFDKQLIVACYFDELVINVTNKTLKEHEFRKGLQALVYGAQLCNILKIDYNFARYIQGYYSQKLADTYYWIAQNKLLVNSWMEKMNKNYKKI